MAFFRPLFNDPFFAAPSSSLLFDNEPFFSPAPLYLYDTPSTRGRAAVARRNGGSGGRTQQQLKDQQASVNDNAQLMVSGGDSNTAAQSKQPSTSPTTAATNNSGSGVANNGVVSRRQPSLLSPLSLLAPFSPMAGSLLSSSAVLPSMSVDMLSSDKEYTVHASVPGVAKQDLKVTVEDGTLTIEAERREETRQPQKAATNKAATSPSAAAADSKEREQKTQSTEAAAAQPMDTQDDSESQYQHVESFYGHVSRSITLPDDCATDGMSARYEDGVLKISIPRVQEKRARGTRLEIQ